MASFGQLLRRHRRQCRDPQRGGPLTQERLGELLGELLGDKGYSGAAVSEWERDRSKIDEDNRLVLVALVGSLHRCGGLESASEANALLQAGNYRALNTAELEQLFPGKITEPSSEPVLEPSTRQATRSSSQRISKERRKQLILLEKVRSFWVEGVLEKAAPGEDRIRPHYRQVGEAVVQPWAGIIGQPLPEGATEAQESPLALFEHSDRSLLILGEPGAGKTMMLLSLARALIDQAEREPLAPIPVILNLVTWAKSREPLEVWAVEELTAKYMIPRRTGRQWLEDDDLILLLDGFDDVPRRRRRRCAEAINRFRSAHGLSGIVICSRTEEYVVAGVRLKLGAAVELQPLSNSQIDGYLESRKPRLDTLRSAVERDVTLRALARNPLMLNIMSLAYDDTETQLSGPRVVEPARLATRRELLFDTYVKSMFGRRVASTSFSQEQATSWLAWLAGRMVIFQQSPMLLEQIQPSWLASRRWRWLYMAVSGLIAGLFTAFIIWLLLQILRLPTPQLGSAMAQRVATDYGLSQTLAEAAILIALNLLLGLVFAFMQGRYFEVVRELPEEVEVRSWQYRRHLALVALIIGSMTFGIGSLIDTPQFALAWATAEAFIFAIITRYIYGVSYNSEIRTVESLGWSWPSALRGFAIGLIAAAVFEVMESLIYTNDGIYLSMIIPAAGGLVLGGIRGRRVEAKSRPNQGILLSLRNSFIAATLSGLILAALALYVRDEEYAADYALRVGLLTFVVAGALFGGGNVIKHYLVRLLLGLRKDLPWNMIGFLDEAADLLFLRKVGGGYIFIHRLLQQYFVSLRPLDSDSGAGLADQGPFKQESELRQMVSEGGS